MQYVEKIDTIDNRHWHGNTMINFKDIIPEIQKMINTACAQSRDVYKEPKTNDDSFYNIREKWLDQQVRVIETNDFLTIVIRGTEIKKFRDLKSDLKAFPKFTRAGIFHGGFYKAARAILKRLDSRINIAVRQKKTITITGHSMGGSIAMIIGEILKIETTVIAIAPIPCMRLFGEPRNGLMVIKNHTDPIPRIRLYKVYRLQGHIIQIGQGGDDFTSLTEAISEIDEIKDDIQHHAIIKYVENTK
jgi:predicted esterase YcpF (UPF0227 family)